MNTLNKWRMRTILQRLDDALAHSVKADASRPCHTIESHTTWCIRLVREDLLDAALGDIAIEVPADDAPAPALVSKIIPGAPRIEERAP